MEATGLCSICGDAFEDPRLVPGCGCKFCYVHIKFLTDEIKSDNPLFECPCGHAVEVDIEKRSQSGSDAFDISFFVRVNALESEAKEKSETTPPPVDKTHQEKFDLIMESSAKAIYAEKEFRENVDAERESILHAIDNEYQRHMTQISTWKEGLIGNLDKACHLLKKNSLVSQDSIEMDRGIVWCEFERTKRVDIPFERISKYLSRLEREPLTTHGSNSDLRAQMQFYLEHTLDCVSGARFVCDVNRGDNELIIFHSNGLNSRVWMSRSPVEHEVSFEVVSPNSGTLGCVSTFELKVFNSSTMSQVDDSEMFVFKKQESIRGDNKGGVFTFWIEPRVCGLYHAKLFINDREVTRRFYVTDFEQKWIHVLTPSTARGIPNSFHLEDRTIHSVDWNGKGSRLTMLVGEFPGVHRSKFIEINEDLSYQSNWCELSTHLERNSLHRLDNYGMVTFAQRRCANLHGVVSDSVGRICVVDGRVWKLGSCFEAGVHGRILTHHRTDLDEKLDRGRWRFSTSPQSFLLRYWAQAHSIIMISDHEGQISAATKVHEDSVNEPFKKTLCMDILSTLQENESGSIVDLFAISAFDSQDVPVEVFIIASKKHLYTLLPMNAFCARVGLYDVNKGHDVVHRAQLLESLPESLMRPMYNTGDAEYRIFGFKLSPSGEQCLIHDSIGIVIAPIQDVLSLAGLRVRR